MNEKIATALVPPLAAILLLYNVLLELQIPLIYDATWRLAIAILACAGVLGALGAACGRVAQTLVLTTCAVALLDVFCGMRGVLEGAVWGGRTAAVATMLSLASAVFVLLLRLRQHAPSMILVFLTVMTGTTAVAKNPKFYADQQGTQSASDLADRWARAESFEDLPIILYIVLDEMMSSGAMTPDLQRGSSTRQALDALVERHGLALFDSVYSRHFFSSETLPNLMAPEYRGETAPGDIFLEQQDDLTENTYFEDLESRGYRTMVFQSALMDFCASPAVDLCETLDSFDPAGMLHAPVSVRAGAIWQVMMRAYDPSYTSVIGRRLLAGAHHAGAPVGVLGIADRYDVQKFSAFFRRIGEFAASAPRGSHIFAHLLVPHAPYLLQEDCSISGRYETGYYLADRFTGAEREERRSEYFTAYLKQVQCVLRHLDMLLADVSQSDNYSDAIIVIHGDHGSRISSGNILEEYVPRDLVDNYGTFFAAKTPLIPQGTSCEFLSLSDAFRRVVQAPNSEERGGHDRLPVLVISREAGGAKIAVPMVLFGCAVTTASELDSASSN